MTSCIIGACPGHHRMLRWKKKEGSFRRCGVRALTSFCSFSRWAVPPVLSPTDVTWQEAHRKGFLSLTFEIIVAQQAWEQRGQEAPENLMPETGGVTRPVWEAHSPQLWLEAGWFLTLGRLVQGLCVMVLVRKGQQWTNKTSPSDQQFNYYCSNTTRKLSIAKSLCVRYCCAFLCIPYQD